MKKSELKAKFGRYSAEEKWQHYFACKKKIKKLKQQLEESFTEEDVNGLIEDRDKTIKFLQKELTEKDNLIEFGREEIKKRNKRIDEIVERDKKLFDDKNKEIECLNKRIDRYENMFRSRIKRTGDMQKNIELYINQLAIQELEKVSHLLVEKMETPTDKLNCFYYIDQQIKELKGAKDDTDK